MAHYFSRNKYQVNIISEETFELWKEQNPEYKNISYSTILKYWKHLRNGIFEGMLNNPAGVDLPFFLGNLSIKVIDIDFECSKDFLRTNLKNKETGNVNERVPFIQSENPKKISITWKKHKLFKSLASLFGMEASRTMKKTISAGVRDRGTNYYEKAFRKEPIASKCDSQEEDSLFDTA